MSVLTWWARLRRTFPRTTPATLLSLPVGGVQRGGGRQGLGTRAGRASAGGRGASDGCACTPHMQRGECVGEQRVHNMGALVVTDSLTQLPTHKISQPPGSQRAGREEPSGAEARRAQCACCCLQACQLLKRCMLTSARPLPAASLSLPLLYVPLSCLSLRTCSLRVSLPCFPALACLPACLSVHSQTTWATMWETLPAWAPTCLVPLPSQPVPRWWLLLSLNWASTTTGQR